MPPRAFYKITILPLVDTSVWQSCPGVGGCKPWEETVLIGSGCPLQKAYTAYSSWSSSPDSHWGSICLPISNAGLVLWEPLQLAMTLASPDLPDLVIRFDVEGCSSEV